MTSWISLSAIALYRRDSIRRWLDVKQQIHMHGVRRSVSLLAVDLFLLCRRSWLSWHRGRRVLTFGPMAPQQRWYVMWRATAWLGIRPECAPAYDFAWHDATIHIEPSPRSAINARCTDISKQRVDCAHARVFGYRLSVDPSSYEGEIVEKSDENGLHDGRTVLAPTLAAPGMVYQRLIDNRVNERLVEDLRVVVVGGRLSLVYRKRRPVAKRFAAGNESTELASVDEAFGAAEQRRVRLMAAELGLEVGEIDCIRDRASGQLYVVDVNKTCAGPPNALGLRDHFRAIQAIGRDLEALLR
jgi:hypothetical protein